VKSGPRAKRSAEITTTLAMRGRKARNDENNTLREAQGEKCAREEHKARIEAKATRQNLTKPNKT